LYARAEKRRKSVLYRRGNHFNLSEFLLFWSQMTAKGRLSCSAVLDDYLQLYSRRGKRKMFATWMEVTGVSVVAGWRRSGWAEAETEVKL
jgi:hypothetical protein